MVGSCIEKMEIPFETPRWNCKFLKRKKKENWSAHSSFSMVGVTVNPESIENQRVRISHYQTDVLFRFDGQANQTIKMILEIFRVLVVEFQ